MSRLLTLFAALLIAVTAYLLLRGQESKPVISSQAPISTIPAKETTATAVPHSPEVPNFQDWREFTSKTGHFKALLPALPQHVTDTVTDPKTQQPRKYETFATAADNGAAFMINAITFSTPGEANAGEESLKAVVNDMLARNKENKLNTMNASTFRGARALDFSLSNGDVLIEGKVFAHDKTMYILSMINKKDSFNKKELDFFINSFDFVDDDNLTPAAHEALPKTK